MPIINSLDPEFTDQLEKLEENSEAIADSTRLEDQRTWYLPPIDTWNGDLYDLTGMTDSFKRTDLNSDYETLIGDTSELATVGESMVVKLQADYVASIERSFRTRHTSYVRSKIHASSRRRGHGDSNGLYSGYIALWLERMLAAAHDNPYD